MRFLGPVPIASPALYDNIIHESRHIHLPLDLGVMEGIGQVVVTGIIDEFIELICCLPLVDQFRDEINTRFIGNHKTGL